MTASISVPGKRGFQKAPSDAAPIIAATPSPESTPAITEDGPSPFIRKPFGNRGQKLQYAARPGYHRHWFNDDPGRIVAAGEAGYTHVVDGKNGRNVSYTVGHREGGQPLLGFLMETPQEWYDEDMALQQREVDKVDEAIHRGNVEGAVGQDGRYVPSRGISISTK